MNEKKNESQKRICQCCGMPLDDEIISRNSDGTPNENYCKWCYADGTFTYSDMETLIDVCVQHMVSDAFTEEQARAYMRQLLPTLLNTGSDTKNSVTTASLSSSSNS